MWRAQRSSSATEPLRRLVAVALALAALGGAGLPEPSVAERLEVEVRDPEGAPVRNAVVHATPLGATPSPPPPSEPVVIDQVDKEFVPFVTAIRVGTRVSFPNRDQIRHHVYSFSEAKTFEIPLYKGTPAELVDFGKAGEVALGCNIHDWMSAYVFVTEAPWHAVTGDEGRADFELPAGAYRLGVWHPRLDAEGRDPTRRIRVDAGEVLRVDVRVGLEPRWSPRRAPSRSTRGYR